MPFVLRFRYRMRSLARFVPFVLTALAAHSAPAQSTTSAAADRLKTLYRLIATGDTLALGRRLAADLRWTVGVNGAILTRATLLAAVSLGQSARVEVDSVTERRIGSASVVDYVRVDHRQLGSLDFVTRWRALAVLNGTENDWQLVRHSLSWLVHPVTPVVLDSTAMQPFVGRYQITPGYIDDVHWERSHLVATATGQRDGADLVPVSTTAFSPDGVGSLIVFERDAAGRVLGYVQGYPDGTVFRATRLP